MVDTIIRGRKKFKRESADLRDFGKTFQFGNPCEF